MDDQDVFLADLLRKCAASVRNMVPTIPAPKPNSSITVKPLATPSARPSSSTTVANPMGSYGPSASNPIKMPSGTPSLNGSITMPKGKGL